MKPVRGAVALQSHTANKTAKSLRIDGAIKSVSRFTWAISLMGLQQLRRAFSPVDFVPCGSPEGLALFWQEFQNKLIAFWLFEYVDVALNLDPDAPLSLTQLAARASELGPYFSVWAKEGVGHYVADRHLARENFPHGLLSQLDTSEIPGASIPLHAGMSLALAESLLDIADRARRMDWQLLSKFIELCLRNCSPGNEGIGFEALGLAARSLHPHLIPVIDATLARRRPELLGYFWHGVGRAIYFSPIQSLAFWPAPWRGLDMCVQEPPHSLGRCNAVAGFVWALTLVNIRQPEILAAFLNWRGKELPEREAFMNGLCSALLVWRDVQPGEQHLPEFLAYQPDSSARSLCRLWKTYVQEPSARILQEGASPFQRKDMGRLFCYRPFADLVPSATNKPERWSDSN